MNIVFLDGASLPFPCCARSKPLPGPRVKKNLDQVVVRFRTVGPQTPKPLNVG